MLKNNSQIHSSIAKFAPAKVAPKVAVAKVTINPVATEVAAVARNSEYQVLLSLGSLCRKRMRANPISH